MNLKFFSRKNEFDIKSLNPRGLNVYKWCFISLISLFFILIIGVIIASRTFLTVYMKDYRLEKEEVNIERIDLKNLKSVIDKRQMMIEEQVSLPQDPSK